MSQAKRPAPRLSFRWADPKTRDKRARYGLGGLYFDHPTSHAQDPVMAAAQAALPGEMLAVRAPRRAAPRSRAAALAALDRAGEAALSAEPDCSLLHRSPGNTRLTPRYGARVYYWSEGGELLAAEVGDLTEGQAMHLRDSVGTGAILRAVRGVIGFFANLRCRALNRETRAERKRREEQESSAAWARRHETAEQRTKREDVERAEGKLVYHARSRKWVAPDFDRCERAWAPGGKRAAQATAYDAVDVEIWIDSGRMPSEWTAAEQVGYRTPPLWASARVVPLLTAAPVRMPDESEEQAA